MAAGRFRDAEGVIRRVPGYTDKEATQQLAVQIERRAALEASGVVDRFAEHRRRPLAEHLADFRKHLESRDNTPGYVLATVKRIETAFEGRGFRFLSDLDASKFAAGAEGMPIPHALQHAHPGGMSRQDVAAPGHEAHRGDGEGGPSKVRSSHELTAAGGSRPQAQLQVALGRESATTALNSLRQAHTIRSRSGGRSLR